MAKNGLSAKARAHAKYCSLGKKYKICQKRAKNRLYLHITAVLCKKRFEKTANIRKMRAF